MKQWAWILILVLVGALMMPTGISAKHLTDESVIVESGKAFAEMGQDTDESLTDDDAAQPEETEGTEDVDETVPDIEEPDGEPELPTEDPDRQESEEEPPEYDDTDEENPPLAPPDEEEKPAQENDPPEPVVSTDDDETIEDEDIVEQSDRIIVTEEAFLYTAFDFYNKAEELVAAYPELLKLDLLGHSADGRPLFALVMAEGIRTRSYEDIYIRRYQLFMEAGIHSRETINPYLLLRTVEDYCLDAVDDAHIPGINVGGILQQGTFHFLILTNPDGYDAVKHGVNSIQNESLRNNLFSLLDGRSLSMLKAGIEGTDRNRNFEDEYFNVSTRRWVNQFYINNADSPTQPALENYPGPYPASEVETRLVQNYVRRYPFRGFLSYHSRGRVVYYVKEYLSTSFNTNILRPFAEMAAAVTGYGIIDSVSSISAGGYFSHYAVNLTQKPALTIETTLVGLYPTPLEYYEEEYQRIQLLPYRAMQYVINQEFFLYRVYVGGKFFHDYRSEAYAGGVAQKYKGHVITQSGLPVYEYMVIFTDGKKIPFSAGSGAPFIKDDRSMIPVRRVAETLGADVVWNEGLNQAEIYWDDQRIEIPINKDYILVNGKKVSMDTVNIIEYSRTYVPLRYVFQSMGYQVSWRYENRQHIIEINSPDA